MKTILLKIFPALVLCAVASTSLYGQDDFYAAQREGWLAKAEASMPVLKKTAHKPLQIVQLVEDANAFQGWKAVGSPIDPIYDAPMNRQSGVVIDLGDHLTGYFTFTLKAMGRTPDAPLRLKFTFGEIPSEVAMPFDPYTGGLSRAWLQDEVVTVSTIPEAITIPRRLSCRYVKIEVTADPGYEFGFSDITFTAETSASGDPAPLPAGVDPMIREIDRVGMSTLRECMQTVYEDGPKRDRRLWIGDLYLEALANNYSFEQHDLTKRCFYLLAGCADPNGCLNGTLFERPQPHPQARQFLLDYSLLYNVALKDYLVATGDRATAEDLWIVAKRQLYNVLPYLRQDGLLDYEKAAREWWIFFDWREGLDKEVALHGLTVFALKETYELAKMLGREGEIAQIPGVVKKMVAAARKNYHDKKSGLYKGSGGQVSYHSQTWMVLGGIATGEEARRALTAVTQTADAVRTGAPYAYHYYVQALVDSGMKEQARQAMTDYWGGMVEKGADTFWEIYDPQNDLLAPYNFVQMNSYCHAWSCTPVYFIRKYPEIFR